MVRTPRCDQNGLKKGTWTPEEDRKLIAYITRYGSWNWRQLPKFAGLARCGKSCRLRWMNYLRPDIRRGNFTQEEEETIIRLHEKWGNRWSAIAARLSGRTDNEIKNYWHTILKKRFQQKSEVTSGRAKVTKSKDLNSSIESEQERPELITDNDPSQGALDKSQIAFARTSPLSPQPSSTKFSCITKDTRTANSNESIVVEDEFALTDEYYANDMSENFWIEPFVADISYVPNEPLVTEPEYFSPVYDAELWGQSILYDDSIGLL